MEILDRFSSIVGASALAFAASLLILVNSSPAHAEKRVAFVVGIKDYPNLLVKDAEGHEHLVAQLKTPLDDVDTMAATLASLKFDVTLAKNVTRKAFLTEFESFKSKIAPGDTALFFYSGHGIALQGGNFLLPSDTDPPTPNGEQLLREWAIPEVSIVAGMQSRGAGLMILVLDACRNNPLTAVETAQALADGRPLSSLTRALPTTLTRGLTLPQIPTDVVGIYSAGFGQTALDRLPNDGEEQKNSVFVRIFAAKIKQPGVSLFELMPDVQTEVASLAATFNEPDGPHLQTPAFLSQSRRQIYLAGLPSNAVAGSMPSVQSTPTVDPAAQAWAATQSTTSEAVLEDFIRQFGSTVYGSMARARLAELKASKPVAVAPRLPSQEETAAQAWAATKDTTSVAVLETFIREFGSGAYGNMARARLEELRRSQIAVVAPPPSDTRTLSHSADRPPPAPPPVQLLSASLGRWAVGDTSNCNVSNKAYYLSLSGGNIVWRNGDGNTDIESVVYSGEAEFRTTTVQSIHNSGRGQPLGTSWVYTRNGPDRILVKPGGRNSFLLARCP